MANEIAVVLTARPSYAKLKPVIAALLDLDVPVDLYMCASALLNRYGSVIEDVYKDFPDLTPTPVYSVLEGSTPETSVLSTGVLTMELGRVMAYKKPKLVVVMADRHETLAATIAASYQNIPVAHIQGGEVSGNIDDKVRNANTMLADYHFPATARAALRVAWLTAGDEPTTIWAYGCPSIDIAKHAMTMPPVTDEELGGDGPSLDLTKPFITILQHPETEQPNLVYTDMWNTLDVAYNSKVPILVFWPGQDSGQEGASKAIRIFRDLHPFRTKRNLPPERFLKLLTQTSVLIGNSSAGIRECAYLGTPVINLGGRQRGRERGWHVTDLPFLNRDRLTQLLLRDGKPYQQNFLYGRGNAGPQIAAKLGALWQSR